MLTGYDLMHQTYALRLLGAEPLARQGVAAQLSHRDGIAQLWDDDGSRQSPAHLRDREQGIVGGDHDIAGGNDASAATEAAALDECDRRHGQTVEPVDGLSGGAADADVLLRRGAGNR